MVLRLEGVPSYQSSWLAKLVGLCRKMLQHFSGERLGKNLFTSWASGSGRKSSSSCFGPALGVWSAAPEAFIAVVAGRQDRPAPNSKKRHATSRIAHGESPLGRHAGFSFRGGARTRSPCRSSQSRGLECAGRVRNSLGQGNNGILLLIFI